MYTLEAIKSNMARHIGDVLEEKIGPEDIVAPPKPDMGDLAFACFRVAKKRGTSTADVAKELARKLENVDQSVEKIEAAGPYLNIKLRAGVFIDRVAREVEQAGEDYGRTEAGQGKQVMLEYANLNSHKEFHVGHLRNILYGLSLNRLLGFAGWHTVPVSYLNDMGSHVAKCLWLFVRRGSYLIERPKPKAVRGKKKAEQLEDPTVTMTEDQWTRYVMENLTVTWAHRMIDAIPAKDHTGKFLGEIYAEASKLLEENEAWKSEVSLVLKKLEDHDKGWAYLWQETRRWSLMELSRYLQDLGADIEKQYLESEFVDRSKQAVDDLLAKGIAIESQGAVIIDFDAYPDPEVQKQKLGVMILRKSDGTLIYATKDIPLAEQKFEDYPKQDLSLIVVDFRQALYFRQLFAALKLLGYAKPLKHLGYEFVTLPDGAMASRKGNIVTLQDFLARAIELARAEVVARHKDEWNDGKIEHAAWCIAMGGVMFTMLRQDPEKPIVFDMAKALAFEGDTGPYVQYAATRLASINQKAKSKKQDLKNADMVVLDHDSEKHLAFVLAQLPEAAARAAAEYKPSIVAQWCLDAASAVSVFYRDVKVLESKNEEVKLARLRLVAAARVALQNGLHLLGINVPDAM